MKKIIYTIGTALLLQGCTYAISPEFSRKADKTITFEMLQVDPDAYKGRLMILGGIIVQTTAIKQGTLIEIEQKRLDYWGKPERMKRTGGKFLAFHSGYLDPWVYSPGRDITVAGEVQGIQVPALGNKQFDYPIILTKEIKLWEPVGESWKKPQWIDPLYNYDPSSGGGRGAGW
jgi:outer membrane lipoprotein